MGLFDLFKSKNKSKAREAEQIRPLAYLPSDRREWSGEHFSYWLADTFFDARAALLERVQADRKNFWATLAREQGSNGRDRIGVYIDGVRVANVTASELASKDGEEIARAVLEDGVNVAVVGLRGRRGTRTLDLAKGKIVEDNRLSGVDAVLELGDFPYKPRIW